MENNKQYLSKISTEELNEYHISSFNGEIVLLDSLKSFNIHFPRLYGKKLLGFDTETKPSFRKGRRNRVSLIQLATDDLAVLVRINKIGIPHELLAILSDPEIAKIGVAVHDDLRFFTGTAGFSPSGFVDLQTFVRNFGIESSGLKKLAAIVLGFRISKHQQVTDWEAEELSDAQKIYAATDAWVCLQIYRKLIAG
ncbi:MAG: 3'-5' exonuclease domain-containing protein 2 [Bacteroidales bacterium]|nr:3'-5' exonuclease domain-containing protein 2 [Bacteroidales bacterium]